MFKLLMNKANINEGVRFPRLDWETSENKVFDFKSYWSIGDPNKFNRDFVKTLNPWIVDFKTEKEQAGLRRKQ